MSCYILSKINKKFKKMKSIKIMGVLLLSVGTVALLTSMKKAVTVLK